MFLQHSPLWLEEKGGTMISLLADEGQHASTFKEKFLNGHGAQQRAADNIIIRPYRL